EFFEKFKGGQKNEIKRKRIQTDC
ncbi:MAG: hypothetical protein H6Q64_389, partial [Firmicutes bacterium]|nr:hypothetical protein [Bacillota bacterium]